MTCDDPRANRRDQERADELVRVERHRLVTAGSVDPIVLDLKGDRLGIGRD
jgi:hypothetical protein